MTLTVIILVLFISIFNSFMFAEMVDIVTFYLDNRKYKGVKIKLYVFNFVKNLMKFIFGVVVVAYLSQFITTGVFLYTLAFSIITSVLLIIHDF